MAQMDRRNNSGAVDPTAYAALKGILDREDEETFRRKDQVIRMMRMLADLTGFDVEERIVLRDRKSGVIFR